MAVLSLDWGCPLFICDFSRTRLVALSYQLVLIVRTSSTEAGRRWKGREGSCAICESSSTLFNSLSGILPLFPTPRSPIPLCNYPRAVAAPAANPCARGRGHLGYFYKAQLEQVILSTLPPRLRKDPSAASSANLFATRRARATHFHMIYPCLLLAHHEQELDLTFKTVQEIEEVLQIQHLQRCRLYLVVHATSVATSATMQKSALRLNDCATTANSLVTNPTSARCRALQKVSLEAEDGDQNCR